MKWFVSLALVALVASTALAGMTTSFSTVEPTANLSPISQTAPSSGDTWKNRNAGDFGQMGSTFLVPAGGMTIDKVSLKLTTNFLDDGSYHVPVSDVRFVIYDAASLADDGVSGAVNGVPTFASLVLFDAEASWPAGMAENSTYFLTFDIDNVTLPAGDYGYYAIMTDGHMYNGAWLHRYGSNDAPNSTYMMVSDGNPTGNGLTGDDAAFWIQTGEIPEPATMALLAVGAVGALIRRRK